jgi:hypothetical protein
MSESAKRIDAIIRHALAPLLKEIGFKKNARNFHRERADRIDVINVQASRYNDASSAKFTANVGVYYPAIAEMSDALPVSGTPKECDCTVHARIGALREDRRDFWWTVEPSSDDAAIANDLAQNVRDYCLPWLERMGSLDAVKDAMASKNGSFIAAAIALHQGNRSEAQGLFNRALNEQPLARSRLVSWARQHALDVEAS